MLRSVNLWLEFVEGFTRPAVSIQFPVHLSRAWVHHVVARLLAWFMTRSILALSNHLTPQIYAREIKTIVAPNQFQWATFVLQYASD